MQVEQVPLEDEQLMALPAVRDRFVEFLREEGEEITAQLIWQTGTRHRRQFVNLISIAGSLGPETCKPFSGMDAFAGRRKKVAFDISAGWEQCRAMQLLGTEFAVLNELMSLCETFVCCMYSQIPIDDVNKFQYCLFCRRSASLHHCHPLAMLWCFMCTTQFIIRLWYGAGHCLTRFSPPSPHGHGWVVKNTALKVEWITQPAAPTGLLELCNCGAL